ncbi:OprD family outer membrane porin [Mangrovivirga sp. M17]|uniref:OprD family outer membrane porin n=1 Tax=Mangrovivirga halotolerans TaxID=2993936 RepID=A0ABT3RR94_9BACT|nr:OprD family outer membrane porin [Mangrovivirga halotolerans]MCX2743904.1 OprD family outer membrane porin [Mangrovivirga halotolerans]
MRLTRLIYSLLFLTSLNVEGQNTDSLKRSDVSGQFRTFYMSTFNKDSLKDFHSLALGGYLKYTYKFSKSFEAGIAGYLSVNTNVQDLSKPDPTTGKLSRYELGLYDLNDPSDNFIPILGELFIRYSKSNHDVKLGRMKVKTPFLNGQDGRMIPTFIQGIWYKNKSFKKTLLEMGIINEISPRSTGGFYSIGESIGKYPTGRNEDGSKSGYKDNTDSDFLIILNIDHKLSEALKFEVWNYYTDNVFNAFYFKPTYQFKNSKTSLSFEWLNQVRVGEGGNSFDSLRYFTSSKSNIVGLQISHKIGKSKFMVAYDYIFPDGRFLFPREWGREFLFSFQKRERTEGFANNHAIVLTYQRKIISGQNVFNTTISAGRHIRPTVTDPELNKYAMPDYTHINLDVFYSNESLKGFKPELLLTWKPGSGNYPDNPNYIINKVDMFQVNVVFNYNF